LYLEHLQLVIPATGLLLAGTAFTHLHWRGGRWQTVIQPIAYGSAAALFCLAPFLAWLPPVDFIESDTVHRTMLQWEQWPSQLLMMFILAALLPRWWHLLPAAPHARPRIW